MKKIISIGEINKSLLYIFLMSVSSVLNKYIYGFTYIECFYPMNIYRTLHNSILGGDGDCRRHRVFDPFFSYIGIIFISFIFLREKIEQEEEEDLNKEKIDQKEKPNSNLAIKLIYNK